MAYPILRAKALSLLAHVLDQLRAKNAFWKSRKIFDQRCKSQLSARFMPLDDQWFQVGTRRVQRSSVSGASGADYDHITSFAHGLFATVTFRLQISDFDARPRFEPERESAAGGYQFIPTEFEPTSFLVFTSYFR